MRFRDNSAIPPANRKALAAQAEKRRQLIVWAANELVTLSERAEQAATSPPGAVANAALATNVNQIELLSRSLAAAMKAP